MAKRKKRRTWPFLLCMALYALAFLLALRYGLGKLSAYLEAYERSRPQNAINAYMDSLTADHIADKSQVLIDQVDHYLQSEEECRQVIKQAVSAPFSYAKKIADCTDDKQVFVIRSGAKVIGTMCMERQEDIGFGFTPWAVTSDSFDLSYLLSDTVSARVPQSYTVLVNGRVLGWEYETESEIPFPQFSEFYGEFELPYMVAYQAGPILGEIKMDVLNQQDAPGAADLDPLEYLKNCTETEQRDLNAITESYLRAYMAFSTRKDNNSTQNYVELCKYMVPGGDLASRMRNAIDGLSWVSDRKAVFNGYETAFLTAIGAGRYLVDVTYTVTTRDYAGPVTAVSRVQLIILNTENGMKVEIMRSF